MASLNQVFLMGNVTRDPQTRATSSNTNVTSFGMAINRHYKAADGASKEETCFVECVAFGRQADVLAKYLKKGKPLLVQGRLKFDAWDDATGAKRTRLSVVVENFQFTGARDGSGGLDGFGARHGEQEKLFEDSEIPF